jgi:hypothetical protein
MPKNALLNEQLNNSIKNISMLGTPNINSYKIGVLNIKGLSLP